MSRFRTILVLGFSIALAILPGVPPPPVVTLRAAIGTGQSRILYVAFSGAASLPDRSVLSFRVHRLEERNAGGRLELRSVDEEGGTIDVAGGAFTWEQLLPAPGLCRVSLELPHTAHRWEFEFDLWGDGLAHRVSAEYRDLEAMAWQIQRMTVRAHIATTDVSTWVRKQTTVTREFAAAAAQLDSGFTPLLPAARRELRRAVGHLMDAIPHFFWTPDGSFGGAYDTSADAWILLPDGARFSFGRMLLLIDRCRDLARREHRLWGVKEGRRTARNAAGLRGRPETRPVLEGMEKTLDRIEAALRAPGAAGVVDPLPPTPPQFVEAAVLRERTRDAQKILAEADRLWDQLNDQRAPTLYRRLLSDFPDLLGGLGARARVANRAKSE